MTGHAGGRRRARRRAEDGSRSANVRVHARLGDPKKTRDLFRRKAAGHGAEYLTLTVGQSGDWPAAPAEDTPGDQVPGESPDHRGNRAMHQRR